MKIETRLRRAFAVILLLVVCVGGSGALLMRRMARTLAAALQDSFQATAATERLAAPYRFTIFAPNTVNFGLLVTYRQAWRPITYQVGRLVKTIPLALCGLGIGIALRMLFWNVGAEGQLAMGGIAASAVALFWAPGLPAPLVLPLMVLAGFATGALWGLIPALLKAYLKVNEIITTLMMNYIALALINFFIFAVWTEGGFQMSPVFTKNAWLPRLRTKNSRTELAACRIKLVRW